MDLNRDYSKLEGEPLKVVLGRNSFGMYTEDIFECKVAGCDPDIGITLTELKTKQPIVCLHASRINKDKSNQTRAKYEAMFDFFIKAIEKGFFKENINNGLSKSPDEMHKSCAFGQ